MIQQTNKIEWKEVELGELLQNKKFALVDGPFGTQMKVADFQTRGVPLIEMQNISEDRFIVDFRRFLKKEKFEELRRSSITSGDLILSKTGSLGYIAIVPEEVKEAIITSRLAKISFDNKKILNEYAYWFLKYTRLRGYWNQFMGSTMPLLNLTRISSLKISLPFSSGKPDLKEQERIVKILEKAETLKQKGKKAGELLDEYLKSVFNEMFYNKGFEEVELGNKKICKIVGEYGSGAGAIEYDGKTRYIRITDIGEDGKLRNEVVSPSTIENKYLLKIGDLLFARTGATVGKTYLHSSNEKNYQYAGYLIRFRFNETIIPEYVYYFTKTNKYLCWVASAQKVVAQPNINAKQYSSLKLPFPPIKLQQKFAKIVEHVEELKENVKKTKQNSEELFNSLMHKAFRGEL